MAIDGNFIDGKFIDKGTPVVVHLDKSFASYYDEWIHVSGSKSPLRAWPRMTRRLIDLEIDYCRPPDKNGVYRRNVPLTQMKLHSWERAWGRMTRRLIDDYRPSDKNRVYRRCAKKVMRSLLHGRSISSTAMCSKGVQKGCGHTEVGTQTESVEDGGIHTVEVGTQTESA